MNNKCWQKRGETETLVHCQWYCKLVRHYGKQYGESTKIKNRTATLPSNSTFWYLCKEKKTQIKKDICTVMFTETLLTIAKT